MQFLWIVCFWYWGDSGRQIKRKDVNTIFGLKKKVKKRGEKKEGRFVVPSHFCKKHKQREIEKNGCVVFCMCQSLPASKRSTRFRLLQAHTRSAFFLLPSSQSFFFLQGCIRQLKNFYNSEKRRGTGITFANDSAKHKQKEEIEAPCVVCYSFFVRLFVCLFVLFLVLLCSISMTGANIRKYNE